MPPNKQIIYNGKENADIVLSLCKDNDLSDA